MDLNLNIKILVLDNYDSFTYNLVHQLEELGYGAQLEVFRNDKISLEEIERFTHILLSPGPGIPEEAGIMPSLLKRYNQTKSILGVCLGHQAIAESFGGKIYNMPTVLHGIAEEINVVNKNAIIFQNIPEKLMVCRYHSWTVQENNLPKELKVTAIDDQERIMAFEHENLKIFGVQFHPESIMTAHGLQMIKSWIET